MRLLPVFVLLAFLSACGGGRDFYTYQAPATPGGKLCVAQCEKARSYGDQSCDLDYRACYAQAQATAQRAYDRYARARLSARLPLTKTPRDFEDTAACTAEKTQCAESCAEPYRACYTSCGGAVVAHASCPLCFWE